MIVQLAPDYYARAAPLYHDAWERSAVEGALTRRRTDRCSVYVDDPDQPTSALVAHVGNYYLGGAPSDPMRQFIADAPAEVPLFAAGYYAFYAIHPAWESILAALAPTSTRVVARRTFRREWDAAPLPDWRARLPAGASIYAINAKLAERVDRELDDQWIGVLWNDDLMSEARYPAQGYARFVESSFGVAMLLNGRVACAYWAFGISDSAASVEVETAQGYRGRGLATLTGYAWLEACRARGMASEWIADSDNDASNKLALRLGHSELRPVRKFVWRDWTMDVTLGYGKWTRAPHALGWMWTRKSTE
jgi:RimJ/RimL family protein N-acetyltransferase